jgi:nucleoid DNA-binding protein
MTKMTKPKMMDAISDKTDLAKKDCTAIYDALVEVVAEQLRTTGAITLPGLVKLTVKDVPARPEHPGKNPFTGEDIIVKAKPASKRIKALPLKPLKDAVT